jgi:serine/threonine protein kinase
VAFEAYCADAEPARDAGGRRGRPPASAFVDLATFGEALGRLGLVEAGELRTWLDTIAPPLDTAKLARVLVAAGRITPYQAAALAQGKVRGLLVGPYLVLDKLGAGGMGLVFRARHRPTGVVVALKLLPPSLTRDRGAVARFLREAKAAAQVRHPNVVAAREAGDHQGLYFLAMDYVAGRDLERVVRARGPLPLDAALDALGQAARGLRAIHETGIVHRDIKPSNLLLAADGRVKILDLGLARLADEAGPGRIDPSSELTHSGMFLGTVDYTPPEQASDARRADHRSDIYALGCTFHYLLTGRPPFPGSTVLDRLLAHRERPAPSLREARPEVPEWLDALFRWAMAKDPEARPQSMAAILAVLKSGGSGASPAGMPLSIDPLDPDVELVPLSSLCPSPLPEDRAGDDFLAEEEDSTPYDLVPLPMPPVPLAAPPARHGGDEEDEDPDDGDEAYPDDDGGGEDEGSYEDDPEESPRPALDWFAAFLGVLLGVAATLATLGALGALNLARLGIRLPGR